MPTAKIETNSRFRKQLAAGVDRAPDPDLPPGPRTPAAVQALQWNLRPELFLERCQARYGDVFTVTIAPRLNASRQRTWVMLSDPAHIKEVFTGDLGAMRAGRANSQIPIMAQTVGEHSILLMDEPEHMVQRKLMSPAFHGARVQGWAELMTKATLDEIARWPVGTPFELWPRMQTITLEVIIRAVFGLQDGERLETVREALRTMLDRGTSTTKELLALFAGEKATRRALGSITEPVDRACFDLIAERREMDLSSSTDVLSMLMGAAYADGSRLTDRELRDELMTLLIAGHESTSSATAWAFERLLRCPEKLERLRDEALSGGHRYADAVAQESLRLFPVLPFVARYLTEPVRVGEHLLPGGIWVAPCGYLVHRRPDIYPEPESFLPERFLEQSPGTYSWIPFGGGPRRCLGASFALLEMRQVLQTVVTTADLRPARDKPERIKRRYLTFTPDRGAEVVMTGRRERMATGDLVATG